MGGSESDCRNTGAVALGPRLSGILGPLQSCGISPLSQDPLSQLLPTQEFVLRLSQTYCSDFFNWEDKFRCSQNQKTGQIIMGPFFPASIQAQNLNLDILLSSVCHLLSNKPPHSCVHTSGLQKGRPVSGWCTKGPHRGETCSESLNT